MAAIFLDANSLIDIVQERPGIRIEDLIGHTLFISPLSLHILTYVSKRRMPDETLGQMQSYFNTVPLDELITKYALQGPTTDFEDNIQLHSAAQAGCDAFITRDAALLKMRFFGKVRIIAGLNDEDIKEDDL